jgi:hypothetical protein
MARTSQPKAPKRISIIGTIDPRKSIDEAIIAVRELGPGHQLWLSGRVSESYLDKIHRQIKIHSFIHLEDHHLSEDTMQTSFAETDVFLCLQKTNAPSGTLLRALAAGVPTVLAGARVLRSACAIYPKNVIWSSLNSRSIADSIRLALELDAKPIGNLPKPMDFAEDLMA